MCERMRAANVTVVTADAKDFDGEHRFERVLLDPPCSGLGTLSSHPDLRWRVSPAGIDRLAGEQDELLAVARRALRPGGTLVYSICTLSPREERLVTADVWRTLPPVDRTDGFYIARDGG
jgi:16S rRNA (cytosine967-C5)-methyltransferase